jgi:hypothetical protein
MVLDFGRVINLTRPDSNDLKAKQTQSKRNKPTKAPGAKLSERCSLLLAAAAAAALLLLMPLWHCQWQFWLLLLLR